MNELEFDDLTPAAQAPSLAPISATQAEPVAAGTSQDRYLGVYPGMPEKEYRRAPGMNKSGMDNFMRSPLHWKTMKENPPPPTPQMAIGSAFHTLVLEPERFALEYVQDNGRQTDAQKEWRKAQYAAGKTPISTKGGADIWNASDWDMIHFMRDAVMTHPTASILIQGQVEQSIFWVDPHTHKLCKGRVDAFNDAHNLLVDLKSTADASFSGSQSSVHRYHYAIQAAFYTDGWQRATGAEKALPFVFLMVEKEPPYGVALYKLEPEWIRVGREIYRRVLERYAECKKEDVWPCYPTEIRDLIMPNYAKYYEIS